MADTADTTPGPGGRSTSRFGFLGRKVGPLPVWAWAGIAVGAYYWYTHFGPGKKTAGTTAHATSVPRPGGGGTRVIVIQDKDGGGQRGKPKPHKGGGGDGGDGGGHHHDRQTAPISRGAQQPVPVPQPAVAPMTAGDVYGAVPTSAIDGTTYDSGVPLDAMEGAYVAAG